MEKMPNRFFRMEFAAPERAVDRKIPVESWTGDEVRPVGVSIIPADRSALPG